MIFCRVFARLIGCCLFMLLVSVFQLNFAFLFKIISILFPCFRVSFHSNHVLQSHSKSSQDSRLSKCPWTESKSSSSKSESLFACCISPFHSANKRMRHKLLNTNKMRENRRETLFPSYTLPLELTTPHPPLSLPCLAKRHWESKLFPWIHLLTRFSLSLSLPPSLSLSPQNFGNAKGEEPRRGTFSTWQRESRILRIGQTTSASGSYHISIRYHE